MIDFKDQILNQIKKLELDPAKVMYDIHKYGNTVSSSIPLLLEKEINNEAKVIL
jgi:3-oxoacyl-[acyl-carrier-protein] synthase-3